ncbi:hypothetical protein OSH11_07570 [Kaistia dalseonensis]|uniref:Uncharacterized protein n=1 Tax=Kaistia dalseonensis TaxID=410840 RepID=A0ABU0H4A0_9HYPH|nr:hypothetical protein [Kaistia dalseonensis]MCX5494555.1 hypothetical protein [Kaistia dalseonensis]MDQ0437135.1 hypothetical protein [Kaistia dalseonensis]
MLSSLIRLAITYLAIGVIILLVQLANTPCASPLVLYDGQSATSGPIDLTRLGKDPNYAMRLGRDVAVWLPRLIDYVALGDISLKRFLLATDCRSIT